MKIKTPSVHAAICAIAIMLFAPLPTASAGLTRGGLRQVLLDYTWSYEDLPKSDKIGWTRVGFNPDGSMTIWHYQSQVNLRRPRTWQIIGPKTVAVRAGDSVRYYVFDDKLTSFKSWDADGTLSKQGARAERYK